MKELSRQKKLLCAGLFVLYICIGFFREFLFMNINEQARISFYHDNDSHVAASLQWLGELSYPTLYYSKWVLTFLFTVLFAFLTSVIIRIAFSDKEKTRLVWYVYAGVFITGIVFYFAGALTGHRYLTYDIARFLAGLTETPALLVILFATFLAAKRS